MRDNGRFSRQNIIGLIIFCLIVISFFAIYFYESNASTQIERYDLAYVETEAQYMIQGYMSRHETTQGEIISCHMLVQNNQLFFFFDYRPLEGNLTLTGLPPEVISRSLFYGYAKIEKNLGVYSVVDFQTSSYDPELGNILASGGGSFTDHRYRCFGKILDGRVNKIEFYDDDTLACTYYVGGRDYYFVELASSIGNTIARFYDGDNRPLE